MFSDIKNIIIRKVSGKGRDEIVVKNIIALMLRKGIGVILSILMLPLMLTTLGTVKYGYWITIFSLVAWLKTFDVGLGDGLKTRLLASFAREDVEESRRLISSGYLSVTIVVIILVAISYAVLEVLKIMMFGGYEYAEVLCATRIVAAYIGIEMITNLLGSVLEADQKTAAWGYFSTTGTAITVASVWILQPVIANNMKYLAIVYSIANLLPVFFGTAYYYKKYYRELRPSIRYVDGKTAGDIASLGVKYFVINISNIVLYGSQNILILATLGAESVTRYDVANRLYAYLVQLHRIIIKPLWSAFGDAYYRNDNKWIIETFAKLNWLWYMMLVIGLLMCVFSEKLIGMWIGPKYYGGLPLYVFMLVVVLVNIKNGMYSYFIYATGQVMHQLYVSIAGAVLYVPVAIIVVNSMELGLNGLIAVSILISACNTAVLRYQKNKMLH